MTSRFLHICIVKITAGRQYNFRWKNINFLGETCTTHQQQNTHIPSCWCWKWVCKYQSKYKQIPKKCIYKISEWVLSKGDSFAINTHIHVFQIIYSNFFLLWNKRAWRHYPLHEEWTICEFIIECEYSVWQHLIQQLSECLTPQRNGR